LLAGGLVSTIWDVWLRQKVDKFRTKLRRERSDPQILAEESNAGPPTELANNNREQSVETQQQTSESGLQRRSVQQSLARDANEDPDAITAVEEDPRQSGVERQTKIPKSAEAEAAIDTVTHIIPVKLGIAVTVIFFGKSGIHLSHADGALFFIYS